MKRHIIVLGGTAILLAVAAICVIDATSERYRDKSVAHTRVPPALSPERNPRVLREPQEEAHATRSGVSDTVALRVRCLKAGSGNNTPLAETVVRVYPNAREGERSKDVSALAEGTADEQGYICFDVAQGLQLEIHAVHQYGEGRSIVSIPSTEADQSNDDIVVHDIVYVVFQRAEVKVRVTSADDLKGKNARIVFSQARIGPLYRPLSRTQTGELRATPESENELRTSVRVPPLVELHWAVFEGATKKMVVSGRIGRQLKPGEKFNLYISAATRVKTRSGRFKVYTPDQVGKLSYLDFVVCAKSGIVLIDRQFQYVENGDELELVLPEQDVDLLIYGRQVAPAVLSLAAGKRDWPMDVHLSSSGTLLMRRSLLKQITNESGRVMVQLSRGLWQAPCRTVESSEHPGFVELLCGAGSELSYVRIGGRAFAVSMKDGETTSLGSPKNEEVRLGRPVPASIRVEFNYRPSTPVYVGATANGVLVLSTWVSTSYGWDYLELQPALPSGVVDLHIGEKGGPHVRQKLNHVEDRQLRVAVIR